MERRGGLAWEVKGLGDEGSGARMGAGGHTAERAERSTRVRGRMCVRVYAPKEPHCVRVPDECSGTK